MQGLVGRQLDMLDMCLFQLHVKQCENFIMKTKAELNDVRLHHINMLTTFPINIADFFGSLYHMFGVTMAT